jgi:hypothetical protein
MQTAAEQRAKSATEPIGNPEQVRAGARQASIVLTSFATTIAANPPRGQPQVALAFAHDAGQISSGLLAIADSKTDAEFATAVFAMCDQDRLTAAPRIGEFLLALAGGIQSNPPPNMTVEIRAQEYNYFATLGLRLTDIPSKCQQASGAIAQADAEEQQAEAKHTANVNTALTAAALLFVGTALVASNLGAAAATRPPVVQQNNYYYGQ